MAIRGVSISISGGGGGASGNIAAAAASARHQKRSGIFVACIAQNRRGGAPPV